jgi:hypothetical protein
VDSVKFEVGRSRVTQALIHLKSITLMKRRICYKVRVIVVCVSVCVQQCRVLVYIVSMCELKISTSCIVSLINSKLHVSS